MRVRSRCGILTLRCDDSDHSPIYGRVHPSRRECAFLLFYDDPHALGGFRVLCRTAVTTRAAKQQRSVVVSTVHGCAYHTIHLDGHFPVCAVAPTVGRGRLVWLNATSRARRCRRSRAITCLCKPPVISLFMFPNEMHRIDSCQDTKRLASSCCFPVAETICRALCRL